MTYPSIRPVRKNGVIDSPHGGEVPSPLPPQPLRHQAEEESVRVVVGHCSNCRCTVTVIRFCSDREEEEELVSGGGGAEEGLTTNAGTEEEDDEDEELMALSDQSRRPLRGRPDVACCIMPQRGPCAPQCGSYLQTKARRDVVARRRPQPVRPHHLGHRTSWRGQLTRCASWGGQLAGADFPADVCGGAASGERPSGAAALAATSAPAGSGDGSGAAMGEPAFNAQIVALLKALPDPVQTLLGIQRAYGGGTAAAGAQGEQAAADEDEDLEVPRAESDEEEEE